MSVTPGASGWFVDPYNPLDLRWFDGAEWTCHTSARDQGIPPPPDLTAPATSPYGPRHAGATPIADSYGSANRPYRLVLPDGAVLAERWQRLVARLVDGIVVAVLIALAFIPWLGPVIPKVVHISPPTSMAFPIVVLAPLIYLVYEIGFLTWKQATPGKLLLGTVVRRLDEPRLTFGDVLKRQILTVAILLAGVSGFLRLLALVSPAWLLWDHDRQTLHDKVAHTVVVLRGPRKPRATD